jgi:hypothetical protein
MKQNMNDSGFRINVCPCISSDLSEHDTLNYRVTCARPIGQCALQVMIDQCLELMEMTAVGGLQRITYLSLFDVVEMYSVMPIQKMY